jgi:hypothetical protein
LPVVDLPAIQLIRINSLAINLNTERWVVMNHKYFQARRISPGEVNLGEVDLAWLEGINTKLSGEFGPY